MSYICKCGNRSFVKALKPVSTPLIPGLTPEQAVSYLRCSKNSCKLPISEALKLKSSCPNCNGESLREVRPTEVGSIINGKIYPHINVMVLECLRCNEKFGEYQLEEQAVFHAYDSGFITQQN